ncbi:uncharacterized protein [Drosophila pseudoobscura]|uniref:Uncharacterized protein n=1 Tax=Drosophila pseudoobscura pseudoobscura TaxID=46245 RepID=A0A6I8VUW3_DROPS|nr:uncharacterized protein LOC117183767 [Drosophila pseudoobscura]
MHRFQFVGFLLLQLLLQGYMYSHRHPGFTQRLQINPLCLELQQRTTPASGAAEIIFSPLEEDTTEAD